MKIYIFIDSKQTVLNTKLINFCKNKFEILEIFNDTNKYENRLFNDSIDFSISFLNPYIIKDEQIIKKKCINFHPSTPKYRGVCGASLAIYNNDKYFGSTAHYIDSKIDNGKIISVSKFLIDNDINCYNLGNMAKQESLKLAINILNDIYKSKKLPIINESINWGNIVMTRNKFKKWMIINITNEEHIQKFKACYNLNYSGPFFKINDELFELKKV